MTVRWRCVRAPHKRGHGRSSHPRGGGLAVARFSAHSRSLAGGRLWSNPHPYGAEDGALLAGECGGAARGAGGGVRR